VIFNGLCLLSFFAILAYNPVSRTSCVPETLYLIVLLVHTCITSFIDKVLVDYKMPDHFLSMK